MALKNDVEARFDRSTFFEISERKEKPVRVFSSWPGIKGNVGLC